MITRMNALAVISSALVCFTALWTITVFAVAIEGNRFNTHSTNDNRGAVPFFSDMIDYAPGMQTHELEHAHTLTLKPHPVLAHAHAHACAR